MAKKRATLSRTLHSRSGTRKCWAQAKNAKKNKKRIYL
jgi:hypothetical protein